MKSPLKRWPLKKLLSRRRSSHEDPQAPEHVKKAFRQDVVTSGVRGRVPTLDTEEWVALSVLPPQDGQNEAPSATVPRMPETVAADAEDVSQDSERIQTSSKANASSFYIADSTRIESSSRTDGSPHDIKDPEMIPLSSPFYGSPLNIEDLMRSDSPTLIRRFSPDGHMTILLDLTGHSQAQEAVSERPDLPDSLSDEQDHLGPFYDESYRPESISEKSDHSKSILGEDHPEPILHWAHHPEPNSDQQGHPESLLEGRSHTQSISDRQPHEMPVSDRPYHSVFIPKRPNPESVTSGVQDLLEPTSHRPESISDQHDYPEPKLEVHGHPTRNSGQQDHPESILKWPDHQAPILVRPDLSESISEGKDHPEPVSAGYYYQEEFISDRQSRAESLRNHKSLMVKGQERRLRRQAKLNNLLSRSLQTRTRAYEKRSQLRQSRFEMSNADEAFMKLIRERRVQGSQYDLALEASFQKLQDSRNEYGPLEEAYNALEEQFNREDYEAKELGEKILKSEISAPGFDINSRSSSSSEEDSEAPEIVREFDHPLYEEYMSRLGDADLCREALSDLMIEHENLLHAQEVRRRVGRELLPDDQVTLENFSAAEVKLLDELRRIEAGVEQLRLECIREGLFGEDENEDDEGEGEQIDLLQPSIGSVDPERTEYEKYPLLLEKPEEKEDENKSKVLLTDFKEGDVGDRITCWLLHKLRSSGLEVELLASFTDGLDRFTDTEKWQEEVLQFWFFDSSNQHPSAYEVEPTLTALPRTPVKEPNKGSRKRFDDAQLIQFSSVLSQKLEFGMRLKLTRMKGRSAITL